MTMTQLAEIRVAAPETQLPGVVTQESQEMYEAARNNAYDQAIKGDETAIAEYYRLQGCLFAFAPGVYAEPFLSEAETRSPL